MDPLVGPLNLHNSFQLKRLSLSISIRRRPVCRPGNELPILDAVHHTSLALCSSSSLLNPWVSNEYPNKTSRHTVDFGAELVGVLLAANFPYLDVRILAHKPLEFFRSRHASFSSNTLTHDSYRFPFAIPAPHTALVGTLDSMLMLGLNVGFPCLSTRTYYLLFPRLSLSFLEPCKNS